MTEQDKQQQKELEKLRYERSVAIAASSAPQTDYCTTCKCGEKFLTLKDVENITNLGATTLRELMKARKFPQPIPLPNGIEKKLWSYFDVQNWFSEVKDGRIE